MPLHNTDLAQLLAAAGVDAEGHRARAYRSAARAALMWSEEAADLVAAGRSLEELERIGPGLAGRVRGWIEDDPPVPEPPPERRDFLSYAHALSVTRVRGPRLRGDLQMHTTYSDGKCSILEMAKRGAALGYEYVAITDHSKGLQVAGGIDEETLAGQGRAIAAVNAELGNGSIRVLRGLEMNIDAEGRGDMDPAALDDLDIVVGSFHSALRRKEDQTQRYVAALRNPHVGIIGHPRGRRFDARVGIVADWDRVVEVAAANGKALEINSYPDRQDLNVELLRLVAGAGGWVSVDTDAHNTEEMRFIDIGVAAALEAGIAEERIVNLLAADDLVAWARGVR